MNVSLKIYSVKKKKKLRSLPNLSSHLRKWSLNDYSRPIMTSGPKQIFLQMLKKKKKFFCVRRDFKTWHCPEEPWMHLCDRQCSGTSPRKYFGTSTRFCVYIPKGGAGWNFFFPRSYKSWIRSWIDCEWFFLGGGVAQNRDSFVVIDLMFFKQIGSF